MKIEYIIGVFALTVSAVCGTLLLLKRMDIAYQERVQNKRIEAAEKNRREEIRMDCTAANWQKLYEEERGKRIALETINESLRKEIGRNRKLLAHVKVAEL